MPAPRRKMSGSPPLPMSREEMAAWGWDELDVLLVSGDAYVDHPSFGVALLGRWLVSQGFRVGIIAQPRWDTPEDMQCLGRPRLFAGVTAGALDSMLAHYTAFRKKRHDDAYTPGGRHGARPNRACIVYTSLLRHAFPGLPIVLGGIEASLRRATHYDFWTEKIRRSILLDSKADLLVYGMGERAILTIAEQLRDVPSQPEALRGIPGTAFTVSRGWHEHADWAEDAMVLPGHEEIVADEAKLMEATLALERHVHDGSRWAVQAVSNREVVFAPPSDPLSTPELDELYALPFTRRPHPRYREKIPAAEMIQFSITSHRGCGGGCTFCSLALHQGRRIRSRSIASLRAEVETLTRHPDWTGSITDVGGPTANMWGAHCAAEGRKCRKASCLTPKICAHFRAEQAELAKLLKRLSAQPGVKHVRVSSGIRHDLALIDEAYLQTFLGEFVGGQLKLAPEHSCDNVLQLMRKPSFKAFEDFLTVFERESRRAGKEQYVVPYLLSAFPGCRDEDMQALADWLRVRGWKPRQVQCFVPTPGTVATAMYYAGIDPEGRPIPVARTDAERLRQHRILMPAERLDTRRGGNIGRIKRGRKSAPRRPDRMD